MELLEKLPIIDTAAPRVGLTMNDIINNIYEKYAKPIKITLLYPVLPKKINEISVIFNSNLSIDMYDSYKFIKFKVLDLIVICIIFKRSKISKKNKKTIYEYHIKCIGTNNTIDINDRSFAFGIRSNTHIIESRGINKSSLPGLEQGTTVTKTSNTLMGYFQPEGFTRIDAAEITCKNGEQFYLSWFRVLTKPTNTDDLSWYNSFGLKRISPYVSNKKRISDTIDRIKNITAKELEEYYENVIDLFSHKKYESIQSSDNIPQGYFLYANLTHLMYVSSFYYKKHPRDIFNHGLKIVKQESPSTTFSEILKKATCEERATLFNTFPYAGNIFAGFYDAELKKEALFPHLKDILVMSKYMIWNNRIYTFKKSSKKQSITRKKTNKLKMA